MTQKSKGTTKKQEIDKYFLKYNKLCRKIFAKECELENLQAKKTSLGSPSLSEKTSGSRNNKGLEHILIQIENLEIFIDKLYTRKENMRKKYISDFKKLSNYNYEIILTGYYLDRTYIKNIAVKLDKSIGHVKKMKREALNELLKVVKKDT